MKIKFSTITVKDLEESSKFYRDILGFSEEKRFSPMDGVKIVFLKDEDSGIIELIEDKNKSKNYDINKESMISIALETVDLNKTLKELRSKGIDIIKGPIEVPSGDRLAFIKDPNGIEIEFIQELNTDR